jgi:hypothetical protein
VRAGEQGTVEEIEKNAQERGIRVTKIDLDAQFRCGGSEEFLLWVNDSWGWSPADLFSGSVIHSVDPTTNARLAALSSTPPAPNQTGF